MAARALSRRASGRAKKRATWSSARLSHQIPTRGARGRPALSRATTPCIWPHAATAATAVPGLRLITALTLSTVADHHRSGSCSAQPGRGVDMLSGLDAMSRREPSALTRAARVVCVPVSMARTDSIGTRGEASPNPSARPYFQFKPKTITPVMGDEVLEHYIVSRSGDAVHLEPGGPLAHTEQVRLPFG